MSITIENLLAIYTPFCGPDNDEVYLSLRYQNDFEMGELEEVRLTSPKGQAILKYAISLLLNRQPRLAETKEFTEVFRGAALTSPRREVGWVAFDEGQSAQKGLTPLGQAIDYMAETNPATLGLPALLAQLTTFAQRLGILDNSVDFPTTPDQLGRQMSEQKEELASAGVFIERRDKARPREWTVHPKGCIPRSQTEMPSGQSTS